MVSLMTGHGIGEEKGGLAITSKIGGFTREIPSINGEIGEAILEKTGEMRDAQFLIFFFNSADSKRGPVALVQNSANMARSIMS